MNNVELKADLLVLPWLAEGIEFDCTNITENELNFICDICGKKFKEERSLKNHSKSVHVSNKKTKSFQCDKCKIKNIERFFNSEEALWNHIIAKHQGKCTVIKPDWFRDDSNKVRKDDDAKIDMCTICQQNFYSVEEKNEHFSQFLPKYGDKQSIVASLIKYKCDICKKRFRDDRARLQHQNYCGLSKA